MTTMIILAVLASVIVIPVAGFMLAPVVSVVVAPLITFLHALWELMKRHKVISAVILLILLFIAF